MGGKNSTQIKQQISTELNMKITNITNNIAKTANESTTEISNSIVQETKATIQQSTSASNVMSAGTLIAKGRDSKITTDQSIDQDITNKAIISIISDASSMQKMGNQIAENIANKIDNNNALKADVQSAASLSQQTSNAGGPEGMLNSLTTMVTGMMANLTGSSSENDMEINIRTAVNQQIDNTTTNLNEITTKIKGAINTSMKQAAEAKCDMATSASNLIQIDSALAMDGGEITSKQMVSMKGFNDCLINLNLGAAVMSAIMNDQKFTSTSETGNTSTGGADSKTEAALSTKTENKSGIMETLQSLISGGMLLYGVIILGIFGLIGFIIYSFVGGSSTPAKSETSKPVNTIGVTGIRKKKVIGKKKLTNLTKPGKIKFHDLSKIPNKPMKNKKKGTRKKGGKKGGGSSSIDTYFFYISMISLLIYLYNKSIKMCGILLIILILFLLKNKFITN
jgi:hypothetical protein